MNAFHEYCRWVASVSVLLGGLLSVAPTFAQEQLTPAGVVETPITESQRHQIFNQGAYRYDVSTDQHHGYTNPVILEELVPLTDPRGQVLSCSGQILDDYSGFRVALYEPDPNDRTGTELGQLVDLTPTENPDIPGNGIAAGILPNRTNVNPYALSTVEEGRYSFLLDRNRGQLAIGSTYILVVSAPPSAGFTERRTLIEITGITPIGSNDREQVSYRATSLDGMPIGVDGSTQVDQTVVVVEDADRQDLQFLAFQFSNTTCHTSQILLQKSGDRANATPGDTVLYRLTVRNNSDAPLTALSITDVLPVGFKLLARTVQGEVADQPVALTVERSGQTLTFTTAAELAVNATFSVVYGAQLTPDALRGEGRNTAIIRAQRTDMDLEVRDGPASHQVRVTAGLLSDCGTLLGRVFEDHNFDGQQQRGEPGIPNAVIWMDDGNRITTDADGLFSVKCVLPGRRTGALDVSTLPGYTLAPNLRFIERNSPSRLVHLSPGGLVQMNFGVTPAFNEEPQ